MCDTCYEENLITDDKIQYTITILPGFLIPHSRVPVPDIWTAANEYLNENKTQQEAALSMNCNSRHSFSRYYRRLCTRIGMWIAFLTGIQDAPPPERNPDVKTAWGKFRNLIGKLRLDKERGSASTGSIIAKFQFAQAVLGSCRMGLGP